MRPASTSSASHRFALAITLALLAAGCGGGTPTPQAIAAPDGSAGDGPEPPDLADERLLLTCGYGLYCLDMSNSAAARAHCTDDLSPVARVRFDALLACLFGDAAAPTAGACDDWGGGVCDPAAPGYVARACDDCLAAAQLAGGACAAALADCHANCTSDFACGTGQQCKGGVCS